MKPTTILLILLTVLILLVLLAPLGVARSVGEVSSRATYTPLPIVTPAPTWAGATPLPAYPAPAYPAPEQRKDRDQAEPTPESGLRCGNCTWW